MEWRFCLFANTYKPQALYSYCWIILAIPQMENGDKIGVKLVKKLLILSDFWSGKYQAHFAILNGRALYILSALASKAK
jgi:hypothetical protein